MKSHINIFFTLSDMRTGEIISDVVGIRIGTNHQWNEVIELHRAFFPTIGYSVESVRLDYVNPNVLDMSAHVFKGARFLHGNGFISPYSVFFNKQKIKSL